MDEDFEQRIKDFGTMLDEKIKDAGIGDVGREPGTTQLDVLYHYTTAEGLQGIFNDGVGFQGKGGSIWATHYKYLNDSTEYVYANKLLDGAIEKKLTNASQVVKAVLEAIRETPGGFLAIAEPYISCFCSDGNLLSQWRGYGAKGGGYAVGLVPNRPMTRLLGKQFTLHKVEYNPNKQKQIVTFFLSELCKVIENFCSGVDVAMIRPPLFEAKKLGRHLEWSINLPYPLDKFVETVMFKFSIIAACMKNKYFKSEQERRLIHMEFKAEGHAHQETKFRSAGGIVVPYIELPLFIEGTRALQIGSGFKLQSITYGPSLHPVLAKRSLELLVSSLDLPYQVEIKGSDIPVKV